MNYDDIRNHLGLFAAINNVELRRSKEKNYGINSNEERQSIDRGVVHDPQLIRS
jgi:argininosuccinate synthase